MQHVALARAHLEDYSAGRLTRRDIERLCARPVGFGELLGQLRASGLPLPRIPSDTATVRLVMDLLTHGDPRDPDPVDG